MGIYCVPVDCTKTWNNVLNKMGIVSIVLERTILKREEMNPRTVITFDNCYGGKSTIAI